MKPKMCWVAPRLVPKPGHRCLSFQLFFCVCILINPKYVWSLHGNRLVPKPGHRCCTAASSFSSFLDEFGGGGEGDGDLGGDVKCGYGRGIYGRFTSE